MYCTRIAFSASSICIHVQKLAILGAIYSFVFFFHLCFNSFEEEGNPVENVACFYINQILFA